MTRSRSWWLPLAGGAALLTVGLALTALEAWWRGQLPLWLTTDAGYIIAYLGILAGFVDASGFVVAARRRAPLLRRPRAPRAPCPQRCWQRLASLRSGSSRS